MNKNALLKRIRRSTCKQRLRLVMAGSKMKDSSGYLLIDEHHNVLEVVGDLWEFAYRRDLLKPSDRIDIPAM